MAMRAPVSGKSSKFKDVPEGTHLARCTRLVDLGTQETKFGDKRQLWIMWEVPGVRQQWESDGEKHDEPAAVSGFYTMSMNEKANLRRILESWQGKAFTEEEAGEFDISSVLGKPCMVTVTHGRKNNGDVRVDVASVTGVPTGINVPDREGELVYFSLDPNDFRAEVLEGLSSWFKEKIKGTFEYSLVSGMSDSAPTGAEEVPF